MTCESCEKWKEQANGYRMRMESAHGAMLRLTEENNELRKQESSVIMQGIQQQASQTTQDTVIAQHVLSKDKEIQSLNDRIAELMGIISGLKKEIRSLKG